MIFGPPKWVTFGLLKLPEYINSDSLRIKQILNNLISNAIKFTSKGVISLSINSVTTKNSNHQITFILKDTGKGIAPEKIEKLFQDFTQEDNSTTREYGGTGLGLSICKKLVQNFNGEISVNSTLGKGSEFIFYIECSRVLEKCLTGEEVKTETFLSSGGSLKVLIVEDNATNAIVATSFLKKFNIYPQVVTNGKECIEIVSKQEFDLIFMDCHMPIMDGYEATRKVLEIKKDRPPRIVALSASTMQEDIKKAYESGVHDFISKPVTLESLSKVLQEIQKKTA